MSSRIPVIIIVDDEPKSEASFAELIKDCMLQKRPSLRVEILSNVLIESSLPKIVDLATKLDSTKFYLHGILIDMIERGNLKAGEELLSQIKPTPSGLPIKCVIYTSKFATIDSAELTLKGADAVLLRDAARESPREFALRVLTAFGL